MNGVAYKFTIIAVCALLVTFSFGPARAQTGEPLTVPIGEADELWEMDDLAPGVPGGEVSYTSEKFPTTFNNLIGERKETKDVTKLIMGSGLTAENPVNGRIVPALAKSWSLSEDGRVYTFHLREGLKFSDGHPLTGEDVLFTYEQLIFNPDVKTERRAILRVEGELPEVELVDKLTVRFKLPSPYGPFLRHVSTGIYPKHKLEGITGEEFNDTWSRETANKKPAEIVGAGPFQLEEFNPGEVIVLTSNPHYYKVDPRGTQLPYLGRYRIVKVKDNDVEFMKFQSGGTDFLRPQIRDMPYLLSNADEEGWNLITGPGVRTSPLNANFLTFNWNTDQDELNELFRKPEFRLAVSKVIDADKIIDEVFNGFGQLQLGPISRLSPYHNPRMNKLIPTDFDPEEARGILDELGIRDDNEDGLREFSSGKPVSFTILVNKENRARTDSAKLISRNLEIVGVDVEIKSLKYEDYTSRLITGNYQAAITSVLANSREPSTLSEVFTSSGVLHLWNLGQSRRLTDWEEEIDRLFQKGLNSERFQDRKTYYYEFQKIFAEKLPVIYLPAERFLYATSPSVKNWKAFNRRGTFLDFAEFIWVKE